MGIDIDKKMAEMTAKMDAEFENVRREFLHLSVLEKAGSGSGDVKLNEQSLLEFIDDKNRDNLKFNFDVDQFESESISVKAVGNKVEVHAHKKVKSGDQEKTEEFSRSFELPSGAPLDPEKITSSFYKDGVLTVELPVSEAIDNKPTDVKA